MYEAMYGHDKLLLLCLHLGGFVINKEYDKLKSFSFNISSAKMLLNLKP
jgi:hypothetical protein